MARIQRIGEQMLSRVLPTTTAEAAPCCGGGCGYQYRCYNGRYQRRYCCSDCQCRNTCGSWQSLVHQFC